MAHLYPPLPRGSPIPPQVLGVPASAVAVTGVAASTRRMRHLLAPGGVAISTAVSSGATSTDVNSRLTGAIANGGLTNAMAKEGIAGATATVAPTSVAAPTTTAPATTSSSTNVASSSCFAATEQLTLENGAVKAISEVTVGDRILSADAAGKLVYSDVVAVPHGPNHVTARFLALTTEAGSSVKMTANHILPAGACALPTLPLVRADQVGVGSWG